MGPGKDVKAQTNGEARQRVRWTQNLRKKVELSRSSLSCGMTDCFGVDVWVDVSGFSDRGRSQVTLPYTALRGDETDDDWTMIGTHSTCWSLRPRRSSLTAFTSANSSLEHA